MDSVKSMSGFLHGINIDRPHDSLITVLEPKLLRSGAGFYDTYLRKTLLSNQNILVLSDLWYSGPGARFSVLPYDNYEVYKEFVRGVVRRTRDQNLIYDIWNEPDNSFIWKGTRLQFYESFKIAHDVIREELGSDAIVSGPSTHWLPVWIYEFAEYCSMNNVQLDVFSYHELHPTDDFYSVQQHLRQLRTAIDDKYKNLGIKEIQVNEYGYYGSQLNPASILGYLYYLERGGADGACRACWNDSDSVSTCWTGTLGGLLTREDLKPRVSWWAYRLYAESIAKRVKSSGSSSSVINFAYQAQNEASLIIANTHRKETVVNLNIKFNDLGALSFVAQSDVSVVIKTFELPNTGEKALEALPLKEERSYPINNNAVEVTFTNVKPLTSYLLEITQDK